MPTKMRSRRAGDGAPVLLLLHGLGATSDVWADWESMLQGRWSGAWLAPDLPGHGGSDPLPRYSFGSVASAVAGLVDPEEPVVVLGHSMGGVVGLALASGWFGVKVQAVVCVGTKVSWPGEDLAKARALAGRPVTWFASRDEAAARYLRVSGLDGLLAVDDAATSAGLLDEDGQWRLAQDPATFGVGAPDMAGLLAAARCPVVLARGEHDPMVTDEQLSALDPAAQTLSGLGHNAHVERPEAVLDLLLATYARSRG